MRRRFPRLAGSRWRINLVGVDIDRDGRTFSGPSYEVTSDPHAPEEHAKRKQRFADKAQPDGCIAEPPIVLESTELDELVIGASRDPWCHLEQMDTGNWWMDVGGLVIRIQVDRDGHATHVYAALETPRENVTYYGDIG